MWVRKSLGGQVSMCGKEKPFSESTREIQLQRDMCVGACV